MSEVFEETAAVLIGGAWRTGKGAGSPGTGSFEVRSPLTGEALGRFPVSPWDEVDEALAAGAEAFEALADAGPWVWAQVLDRLAERLEARADELVDAAHQETGLPAEPRLRNVELPRTTDSSR